MLVDNYTSNSLVSLSANMTANKYSEVRNSYKFLFLLLFILFLCVINTSIQEQVEQRRQTSIIVTFKNVKEHVSDTFTTQTVDPSRHILLDYVHYQHECITWIKHTENYKKVFDNVY